MGRTKRNGIKQEAGVSAVEFGLILPLFLVLLLGIMDYGWVYYTKLTMTNAAREGARVGVTRAATDTPDPVDAAVQAAKNYMGAAGFNLPDGAVSATLNDPTLNVTVVIDFAPLVGFVPTPSTLSATAAMRWELSEVTETGTEP